MAGIFNIFNESESSSLSLNKGKEKSYTLASSKLKSVGNSGFTSAKVFTQPQIKPKGLSIRSKSDLNVAVFNSSGVTKQNSKECMKLQEKQCISNKPSLSPLKLKTPKSKSLSNITEKKLSPKISSPIMQNVVDDYVFRKPATPKQMTKLSNERENLKYYFDYSKYMNDEIENMFEEERNSFRSVRKCDDSGISLEDEGFISDPEIDSFEFPSAIASPLLPLNNVELPDLCDD